MVARQSSPAERLFFVDGIPDTATPPYSVVDSYVSIEESMFGLHVVRVRYMGGPGTVKHQLRVDHGKQRITTDLSEPDYEALRDTRNSRTIQKNRYMHREGEWSTGIDVYEGDVLGGLAIAGVRVRPRGTESIENFTPYDWMGAEITDEPRFLDHRLVRLDQSPFGETELGQGEVILVKPLDKTTP